MPRSSEARRLLLDTHVWLWVVAGGPELSREARGAIAVAIGQGALRISAISLWEVAMLASRGRIVLAKPTSLWLAEALSDPAPAIEPLTAAIAVESCELPEAFHADPAGRMIVATARVTDARLMTRDRRILDYAARGHLTAVSA
jgi:PIN domain nuclease of toxin-antitoxin system